ncbi:MAG: FAD-dependent oxidoreductase [Armatimonadota bacterium]|nr:FAD-dependent oxidoreductase [Armatimonadota bacterium]
MSRIRKALVHVVLAALLVAAVGWTAPAASGIPAELAVDVLVVGGTPGGVAAAIAAARQGARVLLVEGSPSLGGVLTRAWLTTFDVSMRPDGFHVVRGIFLEHYRRMGISFDRDSAARTMGQAVVREPGLRTLVNAPIRRIITAGRRVVAVEFDDLAWHRVVTARPALVIDATDDGDVAAAAGAPYVIGQAVDRTDERWMQAASLIFRLGGVSWTAVCEDILARLEDGADRGQWGINGRAAWGYPQEAAGYQPQHPGVVLYPLNLALERDGTVLVNALNITGVNGLDPASTARATSIARAELPALVEYLRGAVPGFEHAVLLDHAPELYIRETRHIAGLYTLTVDDILSGRVFHDRIAVASYPVDIHPYYVGWTNPYPRHAIEYTIPFRAIVPQNVENLLLATRALSATSEAHGSVRVVPTIMAVGQAAGVAAALAADLGRTPREIADTPMLLLALQGALIAQGAYLGGGP